ncbi:hypothetical protein [Pedomonas mirosovicensis]|uniref:hypothetical protein n=1 Tax=Pedomonas mirosovicensis TaxID=2908641 RepID=UPI002168819C|nr:hypothetical protein [Pedomonas mirosovicensis]MCH8686709.1 hypothetical protein [Pedomonas mirosovicensis]
MIRKKQPGTKAQRADKAEAVPKDVRERGFEPTDVPASGVGKALLLLYVCLGISGAAIAGLLLLSKGTEAGRQTPILARVSPPPPRLETAPLADRLALEAPAKARLRGYTGRQPGAPPASIEDAMQAVASEGWRDATPPPGPAATAKAHAESAR